MYILVSWQWLIFVLAQLPKRSIIFRIKSSKIVSEPLMPYFSYVKQKDGLVIPSRCLYEILHFDFFYIPAKLLLFTTCQIPSRKQKDLVHHLTCIFHQ